MPQLLKTQLPLLISYVPDYDQYQKRIVKLAASGAASQPTLPDGFPHEVKSAMCWDGNSFAQDEWVIQLTNLHLGEIDSAVRFFEGLKIPLGFLSPETFPLPTLGPFIKDTVAKDVYHGKGFAVLRGIPVENYTSTQNIIVHAGLASWLGRLRGRQDKGGNVVMRHIKDMTRSVEKVEIGTAQYTADAQAFHTDFGDVVSLLCIGTPAEGGKSHLASLQRIYNDLVVKSPDVIRVLASDWPFPTFENGGFTAKPVLFYEDGHLMLQYSRRLFTGYQCYRNDSGMLSESHADAMDSLEFLARKYSVSMTLQKGDIQWVNNLGVLHARDQYRDDERNVRELHRLWLRSEEQAWKLPRDLEEQWSEIYHSVPMVCHDFFPIESKLKVMALEGSECKTDPQSQKLEGMEWKKPPTQTLDGMEWKKPPTQTLKGMEWKKPPTQTLEGMEWKKPPTQTLDGMGWKKLPQTQTLDGMGWKKPPTQTLKGMEWKKPPTQTLDGMEWKKPPQTQTLDGMEWKKPPKSQNLDGMEWKNGGPIPQTDSLKGMEWKNEPQPQTLKGMEWKKPPTPPLTGRHWGSKSPGEPQNLKGMEWKKPPTPLKGRHWGSKSQSEKPPTQPLTGRHWGSKSQAEPQNLKGMEW